MSLEETINNEIIAIDKKIDKNNEQRILSKKEINESNNKTVGLLNYNDDIHKKEILLATKHTLQWVLQKKKETD